MSVLVGRAPIGYTGSKWIFKKALDTSGIDFNGYDVIVDVFGGACWLTHYFSRTTTHPRIIVNDYDDFIPFITSDTMCREYSNSALACQVLMSRSAGGNAVVFKTHYGRDTHGNWDHKETVDKVIDLCLSQPLRCMKNAMRCTFAFNSTPTPHGVWYMRNDGIGVRSIPDYIGRAERICCDATDIDLTSITRTGDKVLVVCDPPYSAGGVNRWYNDHNNNITTIYVKDWVSWCSDRFKNVDLLLFGCTNNLQSLPVPSLILKKERTPKRTKEAMSSQLGYYYKR